VFPLTYEVSQMATDPKIDRAPLQCDNACEAFELLTRCKVARSVVGLSSGYELTAEDRIAYLGYDSSPCRQGGACYDGPSIQIIEAHGLKLQHDVMGVSCLFFLAPLFMFLCLRGKARDENRLSYKLAVFIAVYSVVQTICSFLGDYYFCEDDCDDGNRMHRTCNNIDNISAYFIGIVLSPVLVTQLLYSPGRRWALAAGLIFGLGLLCKIPGVAGHLRLYWDTNPASWTNVSVEQTPGGSRLTPDDYRKSIDFMIPDRRKLQRLHISYMLFWHTVWHILGPLTMCILVYALLFYPFTFEKRARSRSQRPSSPCCPEKQRGTPAELTQLVIL